MNENILGFFGEYRWLSNFWFVDVEYDGVVYRSTEHAYQAAKTDNENNREMIRMAATPSVAKRMGKMVELRSDWDKVKDKVMFDLLKQKFSVTNPELRQKLIDTGNAYIEETNTWGDVYWGVCKGKGENKLGKMLMMIREENSNDKRS